MLTSTHRPGYPRMVANPVEILIPNLAKPPSLAPSPPPLGAACRPASRGERGGVVGAKSPIPSACLLRRAPAMPPSARYPLQCAAPPSPSPSPLLLTPLSSLSSIRWVPPLRLTRGHRGASPISSGAPAWADGCGRHLSTLIAPLQAQRCECSPVATCYTMIQ